MISKGTLVPHMIKRAQRPVISEVEVAPKATTPSYTIVLEPEENPEYLVLQIHLPLLVNFSKLSSYHMYRILVQNQN